jgi:hypothetical protein
MIHSKSKFVVDVSEFGVFVILEGKLPTKDGQLWKGETHTGEKMEFAGNTREPDFPTPYWDWSS